MDLGDKAAVLALVERAIAANSVEKDALSRPAPIKVLAAVAAQMGEPRPRHRCFAATAVDTSTYGYSRATYFRSAPGSIQCSIRSEMIRVSKSLSLDPRQNEAASGLVVAWRWLKPVSNSSRAPRTRFC
jgi:hypothetical protein